MTTRTKVLGGLLLAAVWVSGGVYLWADDAEVAAPEAAAEETVAPQSVYDQLSGKTAEEAAAAADQLLKDAIAQGGTEVAMKNRIARLVGSCVGAAGPNLAAVVAALVKAGGAEHEGLVIAAAVVSARAIEADVDAAAQAAKDAASNKEQADDAIANPMKYLGRVLAFRVERAARQWLEAPDVTATTTTTTTTTTVPSATPVGAL